MTGELWDTWVTHLQASLLNIATVDIAGDAQYQATFRPTEDAGASMTLFGRPPFDPLLSYGDDGRARWELDWSDESLAFVEKVVRATCTGHSKQVKALGRTHVLITVEDGTIEETATYEAPWGLIPMPGWKKRS